MREIFKLAWKTAALLFEAVALCVSGCSAPTAAQEPQSHWVFTDTAETIGIKSEHDATADAPVAIPSGEVSTAPPAWRQAVFQVRARSGNVAQWTTAISIGDGYLLTVAHLTQGMNRPRIEVDVHGQWIPASFSPVRQQDLALLRISNRTLPSVSGVRRGDYYEPVTVYGLKSDVEQRGLIVGPDHIAVRPEFSGTVQGDSGGGVFGDDGALLGILRGHNEDPRSVRFTPLEGGEIFLSQARATQEVSRKGILYAPTWCAACKPWVDRVGELPLDVTVRRKEYAKADSYPYFVFESTDSATGWRVWKQDFDSLKRYLR